MKRALTILFLVSLVTRGTAAQQTGAKEMFFDPQRSLSEASSDSAGPHEIDDQGRRLARVNDEQSTQRNLGLSYWIELVEAPGKRGAQVTDERRFRSGERIRLHFRSNSDGQIVLVQIGSSGTSSILFPDSVKGLPDNRIRANKDQVLPSQEHWFRFDHNPGTERLLVLFAKNQADLERTFPIQPVMTTAETLALLRAVDQSHGSKDIYIETESHDPAELGKYVVNVAGRPIALHIALMHR
jgi:Domain of unknown function (DUF4384)